MMIDCPHCATRLPSTSRFCNACGASLDEAPAPAPAAQTGARPPICPGCGTQVPGVQRPGGGGQCQVCAHKLAGPPARPPSTDLVWVAVRSQFQCRSCGHLSPLNHLDTDGSVDCLRCGLNQAFDVSSWHAALEHAHAVGDLAGPDPEGRHPHASLSIAAVNPLRDVGVTRATAGLALSGTRVAGAMTLQRSLRIDAGPGHPVCRRCQVPVSVSVSPQRIQSSCPRCHEVAVYGLPPKVSALAPALRAAIADDHRTDREAARLEADDSQGAVAIKCPSCSAPLDVDGRARYVRCGFCHTSSRIPDRTIFRLLGDSAHVEVWWLAFEGPSPLRHALERAPSPQTQTTERSVPPVEIEQAPVLGAAPLGWLLSLLMPALALIVVGLLGFADKLHAWIP